MRYQDKELRHPSDDTNRDKYDIRIHKKKKRRLRRNSVLLLGVCLVAFFTVSAQGKPTNVTAHNKDKAVEATKEAKSTAKDIGKASSNAGKTQKDTAKDPKNTDKNQKNTDKNPKNTDKNPKSTDKNPKSTDKNPKSTDKNSKNTDKNPKNTDKNPKSTDKNTKIPEKPQIDKSAWNLTLVNKSHPIAKGYTPKLAAVENGHAVDERIGQALKDMLADAGKEGLSPIICSSYRSEATQAALYTDEVNENLCQGFPYEEAEKRASVWVAMPGTSEHQLGLAVDLVSQSYQMLDQAQENTPEQKWLIKNCANYGFILRYPTTKSQITGVGYEPWHYRYVGKDAAKEIMGRGICLEEYLKET